MAETARDRFGTTYGMSVTAFPDGTRSNERYTIAISSKNKTIAKSNPLASHPDIRRDLAAETGDQSVAVARLAPGRLANKRLPAESAA